jgi:hypothetical protein
MKMKARFKLALVALSSALGCSELNTPIYFNGPAPLELTGMEDPPRIMNSFTMQFRRPSDDEQKALDELSAQLKDADPMHRDIKAPWVSRDKVHLEVLFTVQNLDAEEGQFDVVVDGANEFTKYDEMVAGAALAQGNDDPVYLPLLTLHPHLPYSLGPGQKYSGVIREDDFAEAEGDLDAMGRWGPDPADMNAVPPFPAVLINRSEVIPPGMTTSLGMGGVPARVVTPALIEVDVTFTSTKHMICTWMLRVRDDDDRLWHVEGDKHFNPSPALFAPMPAAMP